MFIHLVDETVLAQIFKKYCESDQIYVASRVCSRWRRLIFEKVDISLGVEERKIEWMICNDDDDVKSDPTTKCPLMKVRDEYGEHHIENYDSDTKVVGLVANATSNDQIVRTCVNNNTMNFKEESCSEWLIRELYNSFTYIVDSIISDEILNNNESVNSEEWNSSADEDDNNCDFRCECRKVNIEPGDMKISQCCGTTTCSCFARNLYCGMHFRNYNSTLNLEYNYPIYECNDNCECNPNTCRNRILPFNYNGSVPMDLYLFLKNLKIVWE